MAVDRCVCHDISLARLKQIAAEERLGFEELRERTGCSSSCGLCEPYLRLMLETGQTAIAVLAPERARELSRPRAEAGAGADR